MSPRQERDERVELWRALRIQRGDVVALVGGGGKTSAMLRIGDELTAQGWRVVMTTSTQLGADQLALALHVITQRTDQLACQPLTHSPTLLVGPVNPQTHKASGLRPEVIDRIAPVLGADVVINEADGARVLPFKAPADHEPVITPGTTLVVPVAGMDVIGQPLDAAHVHRPERVTALSGAALGQAVTPELVATVLAHPQGGLKGAPPNARVVVLLNKVQTEARLEAATRVAGLLLDVPRVDAVVIGAVQEADPVRLAKSRVAAVVLAAGESRRFGRLKQLLPWGKGTLLTHAVDVALASRARPVVVVLGCQADACRAALEDPSTGSGRRRPMRVVVNPHWAQGQSTSVRAGLAALPENVSAVLFHLADQPGVTSAVIDALLERHAATLAPVVWPEYEGRRGNPVLFDRVAFPALRELTGDVGGKPLLMAYARSGAVERVAVEEPGILLDVDVPGDLPPT
jgi:molybdenum cofactor cytidylyltransferase